VRAIEKDETNLVEKNWHCWLSRFDEAAQSQILGVQDWTSLVVLLVSYSKRNMYGRCDSTCRCKMARLIIEEYMRF
jgi:hypothetical protein